MHVNMKATNKSILIKIKKEIKKNKKSAQTPDDSVKSSLFLVAVSHHQIMQLQPVNTKLTHLSKDEHAQLSNQSQLIFNLILQKNHFVRLQL